MERETRSVLIGVAAWVTVVQGFFALYIRDHIPDYDGRLDEIEAKLDDLRPEAATQPGSFERNHAAEKDLLNGPGFRLENGKEVPVPEKR